MHLREDVLQSCKVPRLIRPLRTNRYSSRYNSRLSNCWRRRKLLSGRQISFLRRISKADDYDLETRTLAKYFLEVTIMDERFVGCTPSFLAAGAHCMARLMIYMGDWSKAHVAYSNYTWSQLRQLLTAILECCEDPQKHHSAVYEKYTDKRYKRASQYVAGKLAQGFRLPIDNPTPRPLTPMECMSSMGVMLR